MADDDEEVIIEDCPLHKYLASNDFIAANKSIEIELVKYEPSPVKDRSIPIQESFEFQKKITLADHRENLAYIVLRSGFMFPDQISELDSIIDLESIQMKSFSSLQEKLLFSTVFCAGFASVFFSKQNFIIMKVIISALVGLSISKLWKMKNRFCDTNTMKSFITTLRNLSQLSRETFIFISESELLLKSKLLKENIVLAKIDITELKSDDYPLLLPELRKQYYKVLKELCVNFIKTLNFITKSVTLIPAANVSYCSHISMEDLGDALVLPSLGELKKTFNILLLLQSDCLKLLFLSYVTELWDKNNDSALESVMKCLKQFTKTIQGNILNLKLMLNETLSVNHSSHVNNVISSYTGNIPFMLERNDDSFITFSKKLLIKSDINIFSALNEIRLLEERLAKYELMKNSGYVQCDFNQFKMSILDNMMTLKDNLDSFMTCYNDNLSYLISSTRPAPQENVVKHFDSECHEVVKKTSIAVGKTCFIPTNEDEILISLSGPGVSESSCQINQDDFEPVPEPLPKSVLSELKCAIEVKRKEWIERESKALGASKVDLELDGLHPQYNQILPSSKSKANSGGDTILCNKFNLFNNDNTTNACESGSRNSPNASDNEIRSCISSMHMPPSFINSIRLAQEKFSLNTSEEIFD